MRPTIGLLCALIAAPFAAAQEGPARRALRVAFVGDADSPRTQVFARFLERRFTAVTVVGREAADRDALLGADVVLLDWPQSDAARARLPQRVLPAALNGPRGGCRRTQQHR